jgi:hypothetical protein
MSKLVKKRTSWGKSVNKGITLPEELIRERAYEISLRDNCSDTERNWFQALKELNGGK